jgi:putative hydrolase of the HAD superfamily
MPIKNIIFDLGGVILNIDYQLTENAFMKLGCTDFSKLYSQARQTTLFDDFEEGKIDEVVFFYKLKEISGLDASYFDLKKAWNAMLISLPEANYKMLCALGKKYRLFLLSNTNETHIQAFTKLVEKVCPISKFEGLFEKVYYSNRIGVKKPNVAPFLKIILENDLSPDETLFIDDSIQHVQGAAKAGLRAELLPRDKSTEVFLKELSIL